MIVLSDTPQLDNTVKLLCGSGHQVSVGEECAEPVDIEIKGLACFGGEAYVVATGTVVLAILVHDEWLDERHDRLVEGVHEHKLAASAHEFLHLGVKASTCLVALLATLGAFQQLGGRPSLNICEQGL